MSYALGGKKKNKKAMQRNLCSEEQMWQTCQIANKICISPSVVYFLVVSSLPVRNSMSSPPQPCK